MCSCHLSDKTLGCAQLLVLKLSPGRFELEGSVHHASIGTLSQASGGASVFSDTLADVSQLIRNTPHITPYFVTRPIEYVPCCSS